MGTRPLICSEQSGESSFAMYDGIPHQSAQSSATQVLCLAVTLKLIRLRINVRDKMEGHALTIS